MAFESKLSYDTFFVNVFHVSKSFTEKELKNLFSITSFCHFNANVICLCNYFNQRASDKNSFLCHLNANYVMKHFLIRMFFEHLFM